MLSLSLRDVRRLALCRAGLLKPGWAGFPRAGAGGGKRARSAALRIVERFGYLQLDTVSVAGARSHVIVLLSRLRGFRPSLGEALLQPGEPLFEYWGHEASWIPLDLYPAFAWRRRAFRRHPWWGDIIAEHPRIASNLRRRIREEGALRSLDLQGRGSRGWWDLKVARKVAAALWSTGELAIRERRNFQRSWDLPERVVPASVRKRSLRQPAAFDLLLERALAGHGWATTGTLAATWRLRNLRPEIDASLARLERTGEVVRAEVVTEGTGRGRRIRGWIRPADLDLIDRLRRVRPRRNRGVLLSPFDPVLWDRARVDLLFGFDQILEIYKPETQRRYGYYCLPVLAGEALIARVDLKAERAEGKLRVLALHYEETRTSAAPDTVAVAAVTSALTRYADALELSLAGL